MNGTGKPQAAWFCTGNADERYTMVALENLAVEAARQGGTPLAVYQGSPPFSTPPLRFDARDRLARNFEHYTGARVPAVRLEELCRHLAHPRRKALFSAEGGRYSTVFVSGPAVPTEGLPSVADGVVLFAAKGTSTASWVYQTARAFVKKAAELPIAVVVMNAPHLEDAAVFFEEVRKEVVTLLGKELPIRFGGFLRFDPDYLEAAREGGVSLVEAFPGSPVHGQVRYVLQALSAAVPPRSGPSYFDRMAALLSGSGTESAAVIR